MGLWETAKILGQSMQFDGSVMMDSTKYCMKPDQADDGYESIDTLPLPLPSLGLLTSSGHNHNHHNLHHLLDSNGNSGPDGSRMMLGGPGGNNPNLEQMNTLRQTMGMDMANMDHFGIHNNHNNTSHLLHHQHQQQQQQHQLLHNNNNHHHHRSLNTLPPMKQLTEHQQQQQQQQYVGDPYSFVDESANNMCLPSNNNSSSMNSHLPPQAKKRGRRKKQDLNAKEVDNYGIITNRTNNNSSISNNNHNNNCNMQDDESTMMDTKNGRKRHDRFNGLSEEEVVSRTVPDHLAPNLDIVIVGINPGLFAAYTGRHYSGPGNHFWKCLYLSGLVPEPLTAEDDGLLLRHGIGFTNMVSRPTKGSADLTRREIKQGSTTLREKLQKYQPKVAVFNGKLLYSCFSGKKDFPFGRQPEFVEGTNTYIWVMPSSSARCAQLPRAADKVPFYCALKKFRDYLNGLIPEPDESELVFPESGKGANGKNSMMDSTSSSPHLIDDSELGYNDVIVSNKKKRGRPRKSADKQQQQQQQPPPEPPVPTLTSSKQSMAERKQMLLALPDPGKLEKNNNHKNSSKNGFDSSLNNNINNLKRSNSSVGSIVNAAGKPVEPGRKRRGRPKKAKHDDLSTTSPQPLPLPSFGSRSSNTPDMLMETNLNGNGTPNSSSNNSGMINSGTCTQPPPTASSVSSGYSTAASSTGGEERGDRDIRGESTSSSSGGGGGGGRSRTVGSGGPSPSHHDSYTTQSDLSSEISAAISCGSAPQSPLNGQNDNVFESLVMGMGMDHLTGQQLQLQQQQQLQQQHYHQLQLNKLPHNIANLSTSSSSNLSSSPHLMQPTSISTTPSSSLKLSTNNSNNNNMYGSTQNTNPNSNPMSMSIPGSLYNMNPPSLDSMSHHESSSYMPSYHHRHLPTFNDSRLQSSSSNSNSTGRSSQIYQPSNNNNNKSRDPSTESLSMQTTNNTNNNNASSFQNHGTASASSSSSSAHNNNNSNSTNNTSNTGYEPTTKPLDVASKSLSGLESLVDQIPSIGDADILSSHHHHPPPHHPHHGMMSGASSSDSRGLLPDALSAHTQSLSAAATAAALSHHYGHGDAQSGFLPYGGSPSTFVSSAAASHYASPPYYASDLSSFPYCSPAPPPSALFGFSNPYGGYPHHASLHHSPYSTPGGSSPYSGANPYNVQSSMSGSASSSSQRYPQRLHLRQEGMDHMGFGGF